MAKRPSLNFTWLFQCPKCASLVLETAKDDHTDWHEKNGDPLKGEMYIDVMMLPDEMLGTGLQDRWHAGD